MKALLATVLLLCILAGSVEAADPAASVGRLTRDGQGGCSAVLVAPRTALTAGHCVGNRTTWQPADHRGLVFDLGSTSYRVRAIELSGESPFESDGQIRNLSHDWAFLTLADPIGTPAAPSAITSPGALRTAFLTRDTLTKIGWQGKAGRKVTQDCTILGHDETLTLFRFRCGSGMGHGASGSALMVATATGAAVVAVQTAKAEHPQIGTIGIAVIPPADVLTARAGLR